MQCTNCFTCATKMVSKTDHILQSFIISPPHTGYGTVMCSDSYVDRRCINCSCVYLTSFLFFFFLSLCFLSYLFASLLIYFLTHLSTPSRTDPFHFQAGGRRRQPNLALVFLLIFRLTLYQSRPNKAGLKCPYVHKKFLWFQWNLTCR